MPKSSHPGFESGSSQKSRVRSFSGCWTCRAKHVKCDEAQPTCNRCRRLKLECEGYGVKISWTSVRSPTNFKSNSSKRKKSQVPPNGIVTFDQRDSTQRPAASRLRPARDDAPSDGEATLFQKSPQPNTTISSQPVQESSLEDDDPFTSHLCDQLFRSYGTLGLGFAREGSYPPSTDISDTQSKGADTEVSTPLRFDDGDENNDDVSWFPPLQYNARHTKEVPNWSHDKTDVANVTTTMGIQHLDLVPDIGLQCQLIEHWSMHVCDSLNPVPGHHNMFRTVFMPIALEGARADSTTSSGATAVFHLICSASAFHLSSRKVTSDPGCSLEKVALEHHNLGITHLGHNIHQSHNEAQRISILASLIMCILNEAVTVPTPFWHVHLRGAIEWVRNINTQLWHQSESGSAVYQYFMGMAIFAQSQFISGDPNEAVWDLYPVMELQPEQYILDTKYGVPQSILQFIHDMNHIRIQCELLQDRQSPQDTSALSEKLDRLELELFLSVPKKPHPSVGKEYEMLLDHYGHVYYFGALIYLKRIVRGRPLEEVQILVEQSLSHIESLELCTNRPFCPGLWPIAITAFEAGSPALQARMLANLKSMASRSGLGVAAQLLILVQQFWALRKEEGDPNLRWHESVLPSMNNCFILF